MSDTRDSMPAADAMPQSGEHSFNTKPRDGVVKNGADEPTMSTADQQTIQQKEKMEQLQNFNYEMAALNKRKLEAEVKTAEHKANKSQQESRMTSAMTDKQELENQDKKRLLAEEMYLLASGSQKQKEKVMQDKNQREKEIRIQKDQIEEFAKKWEHTEKLKTSIAETKPKVDDLDSKMTDIDSIISDVLPKMREFNTVQAESRDAEIVHLNKKAKIEADIAKSAADAAKSKARNSFPVGTRVKAIMDRQGSTEKRYRMGEIIGFSGDLFKVKFDYPPDQLFQDTPIDNIILYKPTPEPNPVDDAVLDDADL